MHSQSQSFHLGVLRVQASALESVRIDPAFEHPGTVKDGLATPLSNAFAVKAALQQNEEVTIVDAIATTSNIHILTNDAVQATIAIHMAAHHTTTRPHSLRQPFTHLSLATNFCPSSYGPPSVGLCS